MSGVVAGFTVIFVVIAVGYLLGRLGTLGSQGQFVLGRLAFFVATPALLFTTLASSDLSVIFSPTLAVASTTAFAVGALYVVVAKIWLNRPLPELTIGALSASYVNSANLGIPIAVFVLGDATFVAPLLLFQIVVYSPIALTILDLTALRGADAEKLSLIDTVTAPFKNPIVLAGAAGLIVALIGWVPPRPLMQPFELIGGDVGTRCAVGIRALALRSAGAGEGLESTPRRRAGIDAQDRGPTCAGLSDGRISSSASTVISCSPSWSSRRCRRPQNVFIYASRYRRGMVLARDSAFVTTLASIPAIALVTALLA